MIKAVLIDADGIAIAKHGYFSEIYAIQHDIPLEKISSFFNDRFRLCQRGKADLKIEIKPFLKDWKWTGSVEDFLALWFGTETKPNFPVLDSIKRIRTDGVKYCLVTDQEKYRAAYISDVLKFRNVFDKMFYSCDLGYRKLDKDFFKLVIEQLQVEPWEIIYWDDDQADLESAKQWGIETRPYKDLYDFGNQMNDLLVLE